MRQLRRELGITVVKMAVYCLPIGGTGSPPSSERIFLKSRKAGFQTKAKRNSLITLRAGGLT